MAAASFRLVRGAQLAHFLSIVLSTGLLYLGFHFLYLSLELSYLGFHGIHAATRSSEVLRESEVVASLLLLFGMIMQIST